MNKEKINSQEKTEEYVMPDECGQSEQELTQISNEVRKAHYTLINLFVIIIIGLVSAAAFLLLTGEKRAAETENPLTVKTFLSGKFSQNLQDNYVKSLPYPYEFKNANEKLSFLYGIGNKIKKYKDENEGLVLMSDEEIEKVKLTTAQNKEQALMNDEDEEKEPEKTTVKKTTKEKKTETGAQRVTTTKKTTTSKETTAEETTSLTTTNNNPPQVTTTTTIPPSTTNNHIETDIGEEN